MGEGVVAEHVAVPQLAQQHAAVGAGDLPADHEERRARTRRSSMLRNADVSGAGPSSKPIATSRRAGPWKYAPRPLLRQPMRR